MADRLIVIMIQNNKKKSIRKCRKHRVTHLRPKTKSILVSTLPIQVKLVRKLAGRRASSSLEQLILTSRNWKMITTMLKTRRKEVLVAAGTAAVMRRIILSNNIVAMPEKMNTHCVHQSSRAISYKQKLRRKKCSLVNKRQGSRNTIY